MNGFMKRQWKDRVLLFTDTYKRMLDQYPVEVAGPGSLVGGVPGFENENEAFFYFIQQYDNMHYPMGDAFLKYGINGILERTRPQDIDREEEAVYRSSIHQVYASIRDYIGKHRAAALRSMGESRDSDREEYRRLERIAATCERLGEGIPGNFREALQLYWFMYLCRGPAGCGCIGRLDQKLYPFYLAEKEREEIQDEEALALIAEFYRRLNDIASGDTLRNMMLSGQTEDGEDETNELTYLFLEAYQRYPDAEPHLNVRIHQKTPERLKQLCQEMLAQGYGQPTLYFDDHIIPAMEAAGIPFGSACRYANDGCTETLIDGQSSIYFLQHEMVKTVELTIFNGQENPSVYPVAVRKSAKKSAPFTARTNLLLGYQSGDVTGMRSFEEFYQTFLRQLDAQMKEWLRRLDEQIAADEQDTVTSPFIGGTLAKCLENGRDPLRGGGFTVPCYQLLSGSVTTAADCLRGIEAAVFEHGWCTMQELREALAADFKGWEILHQRLIHVPKYGNGDIRADELAGALGNHFCDYVNAYRSPSGKRVWPGLYNIDFKQFASIVGATPDGRRWRDPIAEHCSPTPGAARKGPTAIISSASRLPLHKGYASSPLHLTLPKNTGIMPVDQSQIVGRLAAACCEAGVPVLNIALYDKAVLEKARDNPEQYPDVIVRVWGFNARFVELDRELQEHIIGRI